MNIGPKLPLPFCLQLKVLDNVRSISTKTENLSDSISIETVEQKLTQNNHIVLKIYTCAKCNIKHTDSALHGAHVATCDGRSTCDDATSQVCSFKDRNGLFPCEFCRFKFKHESNLISHQNKHMKTKGFVCYVCGIELVSVKKLQNHYNDFHKNHSKIFGCNFCEYSNVSAARLKDHMVSHNSDKYLYCYKCTQNYDSLNDFNEHSCKGFSKTVLKRKKLPEVKKSIGKQSTKSHLSVKFSNLQSKFESEVIRTNNIYYCNGCSYTFTNYENLVKHRKEHLKIQPYKCSVCKYESFSVVDMSKHVRCHSSQDKKSISIKCNVCFMKFNKFRILRKHAVSHIYDKIYCSSCRVNFEDSESFSQHMSVSHKQSIESKMYSCSKCSFTHPIVSALRRHMRIHNLNEENKISPESKGQVLDSHLKCNEITKIVNLPSKKSGSSKATSVSSAFKCRSCRIRFDNAVDFEKHNKGHLAKSSLISLNQREDSPKLVFKCNKCKYDCSDINSLIDHVKFNHLNRETPFTCLVCDHKMESLTKYLPHLKSHSEIPTYCCQYCKYHTRREKAFLQHYNKHKLKCCPMCIYSTRSFQVLKDHVHRHHTPGNVQAPFICTLCPYSSSNEKVLSVHALKFHPIEYPSLKLPVPNYLQKSFKNDEDKLHVCSMCQFTNHRIHDFKRHLTKHFLNGKFHKTISKKVKKKSLALKSSYLKKLHTCKIKASKVVSLFHYKCSQCNFVSKLRGSVSGHLLRIHNIKGGVRNSMILKRNGPLFNNTNNNKLKTDKIVKMCQKCEVGTFSLGAQKQHRRLGHTAFWARPFSCLKCNSRFKKEMYLGMHECRQSKPLLVCKICKKYKTIFEQKMKNHSQNCSKSSTTTKNISTSSKTPHCQLNIKTQVPKKIECEEQHSSGDENFSCGECNFITIDVTDLINHMFIHSGVPDD